MKALLALIAVAVAAAGGFAAGYLPELRRRTDAETKLRAAEEEVAAARALLGIYALHDRILHLVETTSEPSRFDEAQALSTTFFDLVRTQAASTTDAAAQAALSEVLASRDAVTAALARRDPIVQSLLRRIRDKLHPLLGERAPNASSTAKPN